MSKRQIPSSQRPEPQPFSCGLSTRAWASGRVAGPSPAAGRTPCWRPASCPRPGWRGLASDVGYDGAEGLARLVRLQVGYQEPRLLVPSSQQASSSVHSNRPRAKQRIPKSVGPHPVVATHRGFDPRSRNREVPHEVRITPPTALDPGVSGNHQQVSSGATTCFQETDQAQTPQHHGVYLPELRTSPTGALEGRPAHHM